VLAALALAVLAVAGGGLASQAARWTELHQDCTQIAMLARDCVEGPGCFVRQGPFGKVSTTGISHGPVFADLLVAVRALGGEPWVAGLVLAWLRGAALALLFLVAARAGGLLAGVVALALGLQVGALGLAAAGVVWNPALLPLPAALFLACALAHWRAPHPTWMAAAGFALGLGTLTHLAFGAHALGLVLLVARAPRGERLRHALAGFGAALATLQVVAPGLTAQTAFLQSLAPRPGAREVAGFHPWYLLAFGPALALGAGLLVAWLARRGRELLQRLRPFPQWVGGAWPRLAVTVVTVIALLAVFSPKLAQPPVAPATLYTQEEARLVARVLDRELGLGFEEACLQLRGGRSHDLLVQGLGLFLPWRGERSDRLAVQVVKLPGGTAGSPGAEAWSAGARPGSAFGWRELARDDAGVALLLRTLQPVVEWGGAARCELEGGDPVPCRWVPVQPMCDLRRRVDPGDVDVWSTRTEPGLVPSRPPRAPTGSGALYLLPLDVAALGAGVTLVLPDFRGAPALVPGAVVVGVVGARAAGGLPARAVTLGPQPGATRAWLLLLADSAPHESPDAPPPLLELDPADPLAAALSSTAPLPPQAVTLAAALARLGPADLALQTAPPPPAGPAFPPEPRVPFAYTALVTALLALLLAALSLAGARRAIRDGA
jgi:hypothetical protein